MSNNYPWEEYPCELCSPHEHTPSKDEASAEKYRRWKAFLAGMEAERAGVGVFDALTAFERLP